MASYSQKRHLQAGRRCGVGKYQHVTERRSRHEQCQPAKDSSTACAQKITDGIVSGH